MEKAALHFHEFLRKASSTPGVTLLFLRELWPTLAGDELARKSMPLRLGEDKTLVVAVDGDLWCREFGSGEVPQLLRRSINNFWQGRLVERIRFENRLKGDNG